MGDGVYIEPVVKGQTMRLLDVLVVGPAVFAGGCTLFSKENKILGVLLMAFGLGTVAHNTMNWFLVRDALGKTEEPR
jgi:hypothetical protein